jgi:competence protein ComEC
MARYPLLGIAAAYAGGILLARVLHPGLSVAAWLLLIAGCMLLCGLLALRRDHVLLASGLVIGGFLFAGCAAMALFPFRLLPDRLSDFASYQGSRKKAVEAVATIVTAPLRMPSGFQFDAEVTGIHTHGRREKRRAEVQMRMYVPPTARAWAAAEALHLRAGDRIEAAVQFYRPRVYENPGAFDYRRWLRSIKDIAWEGEIQTPFVVRKLPGYGLWFGARLVQRVRQRVLSSINHLYPPWSAQGRDGAVLKAVLVGDRSALDSKTIQSFRRSGLYHLLVISGLHVGLLAALVLALLGWLRVREGKRYLAAVLFLVGYAALVEQRAPTLRATLMIGIYLLARYLYRDREGLNAVGFAALILLIWRPAWLFEAGFQLSFSAALLIFGLVVPILARTTEPYRKALSWMDDSARVSAVTEGPERFRQRLLGLKKALQRKFAAFGRHPTWAEIAAVGPARGVLWMVEWIAFSAALQLGLLMPMAELFHWVTFAGIALNALAIPVMTALLATAIPTVVLAMIVPRAAVWPGKLVADIMAALFALTRVPIHPEWLAYRVPGPPLWVALLFAASLLVAAWTLAGHRKLFGGAIATFGISAALVACYPFPAKIPKGIFQVTALDCGKGEATLVVLPNQTTMMIGACGSPMSWGSATDYQGRWNPGEEIVSPYLWSRGLKRISVLVANNTTAGVLRGMAAVAWNFRPHELWLASSAESLQDLPLRQWARRKGVKIQNLRVGEVFHLGSTDVQMIGSPQSTDLPPEPTDLSLEFKQGRDRALLLDGLTEKEARGVSVQDRHPNRELWVGSQAMFSVPAAMPKILILDRAGQDGWKAQASLARRLAGNRSRFFSTRRDGMVTARVGQDRIAVTCFKSPLTCGQDPPVAP